jgi:hypothetical protein
LFPTVALPKAFDSRHSPAIEKIVKPCNRRFGKFLQEFSAPMAARRTSIASTRNFAEKNCSPANTNLTRYTGNKKEARFAC